MERKETRFESIIESLYISAMGQGILLTSSGKNGNPNIMTLGWILVGGVYHGHPIAVVAVRPACYSFKLLDEVNEFVLCIPSPEIADAVSFCGTKSGRDYDKFKETGLMPVSSFHVTPPSIAQCPVNIECKIYHKQRPPHYILTPEHRKSPLEEQHTIYFAEVLGTYMTR